MGSQPIRIQLGKILWENPAGQGGGEKANLRKAVIGGNLAFGRGWWGTNQSGSSSGKSCGKFLQENLVRKSCRKIMWENLTGNSCGTRRRGKSQFKKGGDWWKFSIWNRVMGSQPIRIQLGKILRENLAGNSCGKILLEIWWEMLWDIPHTYPQAVFEGNFQNMQFI